jgi:secreted PhoX family phosphatase
MRTLIICFSFPFQWIDSFNVKVSPIKRKWFFNWQNGYAKFNFSRTLMLGLFDRIEINGEKGLEKQNRRDFIRVLGSFGVTAQMAPFISLFQSCKKTNNSSGEGPRSLRRKIGELLPQQNDLLSFPQNFQAMKISIEGNPMSDGAHMPTKHDGMGVFPGPNGTQIILRNHEVGSSSGGIPFPQYSYDPSAHGGVTFTQLDSQNRVLKEGWALTGTVRNCAGGITPWNSWLSCEETFSGPQNSPFERPHGYVFEVPADMGRLKKIEPIIEMGRFNHEAAVVDPNTGHVYLTEDRGDSCFYRFIPKVKGQLNLGGTLYALQITGTKKYYTGTDFPKNKPLQINWIEIDDPNPEADTVRLEAQRKGAAIFVRGEGICIGDEGVFFSCTSGGNNSSGQIFKFTDLGSNSGKIELVIESDDSNQFYFPDNITFSPWGDLIICEDGGNPNFIRGIRPDGLVYDIASTNNGEWAGACFSLDGRTLFVNIQHAGTTMAITGDWERLRS